MAVVFKRPSLLARVSPWLRGFDGPLAFAVFLLACAGLLVMYSSGHDQGTRFVDHGRNMLIAGFILFVVAQIPTDRHFNRMSASMAPWNSHQPAWKPVI